MTDGELAEAYNAGMKAEQGQGQAFFPHRPNSLLGRKWAEGFRHSKADRANRERAADERLDADTEWD